MELKNININNNEEIKKIKRQCYFKNETLIFISWMLFTIFLIIALGFKWFTPEEPPYLSAMVDIYKYFTGFGILAKTLGHATFKLVKDILEIIERLKK